MTATNERLDRIASTLEAIKNTPTTTQTTVNMDSTKMGEVIDESARAIQ